MVTIGVTGHRDLDVSDRLIAAVDRVLQTIRKTYPGEGISVVSSLAEGADRLVVFRAMIDPEVSLVVPLPFDASEYMLDFQSMVSKAEFANLLEQADQVITLPAGDTRQASYQAAGLYVLDHSDVLVAVWDGEPARGIGGTAEIVAEARLRGMPLAWVEVRGKPRDNRSKSGKILVDLQYERFPDQTEREAGAP